MTDRFLLQPARLVQLLARGLMVCFILAPLVFMASGTPWWPVAASIAGVAIVASWQLFRLTGRGGKGGRIEISGAGILVIHDVYLTGRWLMAWEMIGEVSVHFGNQPARHATLGELVVEDGPVRDLPFLAVRSDHLQVRFNGPCEVPVRLAGSTARLSPFVGRTGGIAGVNLAIDSQHYQSLCDTLTRMGLDLN